MFEPQRGICITHQRGQIKRSSRTFPFPRQHNMNCVKSFPYHPLVPMSLPPLQILNTISLGLVSEVSTKAGEGIGFKFYNN
jgi:hypothetical protein